jgi:cycloeucalenol cycloisomerase
MVGEKFESMHIAVLMSLIFVGILCGIGVLGLFLERGDADKATLLPLASRALQKRQFEKYALGYTVVWIAIFGVVVALKLYESFDANSYMALCVSLAAPFLLQPVLWPLPAEKNFPLTERYSFKANLWIAIFSFIGNYWYTHYFYTVLEAKYTFPAHRFNNVPISMYFATHFYFVTYHTFSNIMLRAIESTYLPTMARTLVFWAAVFGFAYFTAFMETLSISSFPCYAFDKPIEDIFIKGSAFYGIYFIVSYPVFYNLDEKVGIQGRVTHGIYNTVMEAMGCGMIVMCLLDFCRLYLKIDFSMMGSEGAYYLFENQCSFE